MKNTSVQIRMENINKSFSGVKVLKDVHFEANKGEIHALMGENGAGKSTLMKILSGVYSKDSGDIFINEQPVTIHNPRDGIKNGVSVIYQEFALVNDLTVAENLFIDNLKGDGRTINWKKLYKKTRTLLDSLGFPQISEKAIVKNLSVAYQQVVEICKSLSRNSSILVLDEPTAVLSSREVVRLFELLRKMRDDGVCIIYISHRLEEIFSLCDRITVLRDGEYINTVKVSECTDKELVNMMIGHDLGSYFPERVSNIGDTVFEIKNIKRGDVVKNVSFEVKAGEVYGLYGLVGAGRTETMRCVYGEDKKEGGDIICEGKKVNIRNPRSALKAGLAMLSEDRKGQGLLLEQPIKDNITISAMHKFSSRIGVINFKKEKDYSKKMSEQLQIKMGSINNKVASLSGGNQQKVSLAKILAPDCKVLILDEPTRGVDVGAKIEIYKIINQLAMEGNAVIMISSEMPEVIGMCDRIAVMRNGELAGILDKEEINEHNLISLSMGVEQ